MNAQREFDGAMSMTITLDMLKNTPGVDVCDPRKADQENKTIFQQIGPGDPSTYDLTKASTLFGPNGNFAGNWAVFSTPATANQEFAVQHGLNQAPIVVVPFLPVAAGAKIVKLSISKAADASYCYFKCPDASDVSTVCGVWLW